MGDFEYSKKDLIGHGAFAVVFKGRHRKVNGDGAVTQSCGSSPGPRCAAGGCGGAGPAESCSVSTVMCIHKEIGQPGCVLSCWAAPRTSREVQLRGG